MELKSETEHIASKMLGMARKVTGKEYVSYRTDKEKKVFNEDVRQRRCLMKMLGKEDS